MTNQFMGVGNLGADPEIKTTNSGEKVANLRLALSERYQDRDGQMQERTTWVSVVVFGAQADRVEGARKGQGCLVIGKLQNRAWKDREGHDRVSTEIVVGNFASGARIELLAPRPQQNQQTSAPRAPQRNYGTQRGSQTSKPQTQTREDIDDDVPW